MMANHNHHRLPQQQQQQQQQKKQQHTSIPLRKVASPRFLFLLVCFLICSLVIRNWKYWNVVFSAVDPLQQIPWTEPFIAKQATNQSVNLSFAHPLKQGTMTVMLLSPKASMNYSVNLSTTALTESFMPKSSRNHSVNASADGPLHKEALKEPDPSHPVMALKEPPPKQATNQSVNSSVFVNPYILSKRPRRTNGTMFRCGFGTGRLVRLLFDDFFDDPEYDGLKRPDDDNIVPRFTKDNINNPADIIYFGSVSGPCNGTNKEWLKEHFPGKVLFQNGESHGDGRGPKHYMISSLENSDRNVRVPFVSVVFVGSVPQPMWPILTNPTHHPRPRNSGRHFMVFAVSNCVRFRVNVAIALSEVGVIHHGKCNPSAYGNFTPLVNDAAEWTTNFQAFSQFRFCLVMENNLVNGYVTEKILNAFLAGCIPIWYGTTDVYDIFHQKSFLYVDPFDSESVTELVQRVRYLEENSSAYEEMFSYPILAQGNETLEQYFSLDDSIGQGRLKHDIRVMLGLEDERYRQIG